MPSRLTQEQRERLTAALNPPEYTVLPGGRQVRIHVGNCVLVDVPDLRALLADSAALEAAERERDRAQMALSGLADCINTELRSNGPIGVHEPSSHEDMRPSVRALVDYVRERGERDAAVLRAQVARLRAALEAFVFALGTEGSLCNQPAWRELRNAAQAALRSTAPEGEEGGTR